MVICETPDFKFPMLADIYYPTIEQSAYGNVQKNWVLDKTIAANINPTGVSSKPDVKTNVNITQENLLEGMVKTDIRVSSRDGKNAITNVIVTNIRSKGNTPIYLETAGPRAGKSTIFELATLEPFVGPFGDIEHYRLILRRSENQAVDV
jgi:hypothetical protein